MKKVTQKISLMAAGVMLLFGVSAFASSAAESQQGTAQPPMNKIPYEQLSDEQKTQIKEKRAEKQAAMTQRQEKWNALTDEQRAEVYSIMDERNAIDSKLVDKYLELGIISAEEAENMKSDISSENNFTRENKLMPGVKGKGGCHGSRGGFRPEIPAKTEASS